MTGWIDGSWHKLRDWAGHEANTIRAEARLFMTRADCLQLAIERSEVIAAGQIVRDFRELDLREVVNDILAVLRQCLVVMITSTGGGALIGGIAGGIGGAGVGAIPGAALGAAAGAQVGEWILIVMGLKALAEYIVRDMPTIARHYGDGLRQAWLAASAPPLPQQQPHVDVFALQNAAATLARGHVAMFVLLLMGVVAYLAKGRGNIGELADNVRNSKLGSRFAEWMVRNEEKLKAEPRLRRVEGTPLTTESLVTSPSESNNRVKARRIASQPRATAPPPTVPAKSTPNKTTTADSDVGKSGVYFFDQQVLPYIDRPNATLGQQNQAQFFMPAEDSALVTDAGSAYLYSGGAPSLERAYMGDGEVFGVEFPLKDLPARLPTADDTTLEHFLEGGHTALKLPDGGGYLVNPTREFVVPGGNPMPPGSILFKIAPDGSHIPIRSW